VSRRPFSAKSSSRILFGVVGQRFEGDINFSRSQDHLRDRSG
jgi:hypothetical protein